MIFKCNNVSKCEKPLKAFLNNDVFKLYLSDVGILLEISYKDLEFDEKFMYRGVIAENYVANEFLEIFPKLYILVLTFTFFNPKSSSTTIFRTII